MEKVTQLLTRFTANPVLLMGACGALFVVVFIIALIVVKQKQGTEKQEDETELTMGSSKKEKPAREKGKEKGAAEKKSTKMMSIESTQEMSPILDVRNGVIITKDGRYFKLMEFAPINFGLLSPSERDVIIEQFSGVIRTWPKNVHIKIISAKADVTPFLNDLNNSKKRELNANNRQCANMIEDQIRMLNDISNARGVARRFFVIIEYEGSGKLKRKPDFEEVANSLDREARNIASAMESCGNILISSNKRDYILDVLYTILSKSQADVYSFAERKADIMTKYEIANHDMPVDEESIPVNDFIAPNKIDASFSPKYMVIDGKYLMYCYVPSSAYPSKCIGGWLSVLFNYMDGVDIDFWIKKEEVENVQRRLQFEMKQNKVKLWHTDDVSQDYEDIGEALQAGYYFKEQIAKGDDFCYMSTIVTITADSLEELNARYQALSNYFIRNDLSLKKLYFQQETAYKACMPTAVYDKGIFAKSKRNIMASDLGSCYPFTAYELNDKGGIFLGINDDYGSPVFINTFDTSKYQNANMIILGPSGSGKTFSLMSMLLRMRQRGLQIMIIAPLKGHEFYRACTAIGGEFISIKPGSNQNINIMEIRKKDTGDSSLIDGMQETSTGSIVADKVQQLLRFFSLLIPDITSEEKQIVDECLVQTYKKFGMDTSNNKTLIDTKKGNGEYKEMPVLGDVQETVKTFGYEMFGANACRRIYNSLTKFVSGSAKNFNMQTNVNLDNKFVVLDVSDLTPEMLPIGMFIALDFVLDKAKQDRTKRKVVAIDEMWRLMKASSLSAEFVVEVFKVIRGYAGAAIGATQDLDDVISDESGAAIINNTKIKLLLPMDKREADAVAKVIDLTSEEMAKMKRTALTKDGGGRRALIVANNNHIFIRIKASQTEFDLITTDASELARIAKSKQLDLGKKGN